MNVMAAICNSFSGRRSFALLTRSPRLNERAPVEEAGLKTRSHNMDMSKEDHITTFPKRGLKTRSYGIDMNDKNHLTTLPKRDLKRSK